jgi:hypothetical protein
VLGPRQVSEHVNNNRSTNHYRGCEHGNAKRKLTHRTPLTLLPVFYSAVKTLLTIWVGHYTPNQKVRFNSALLSPCHTLPDGTQ